LTDSVRDSSISTDLVRMLLGGAPLANGAVAKILILAGIPPEALASPGWSRAARSRFSASAPGPASPCTGSMWSASSPCSSPS
jgi:hypothetical protein